MLKSRHFTVTFSKNEKATSFSPYVAILLLVLVLSMCCSYLYFDQVIANYCHEIVSFYRKIYKQVTKLIFPPTHLMLWPALFLGFFFLTKKEKTTNFLLQAATVQGITACAVRVLKVVIGRARPQLLFKENLFDFNLMSFNHHYHSFPSGHSVTIFALAASFAYLVPKYRTLFFAIGLGLAASRVLLNYHYLSDVLGGAIIGVIISYLTHFALDKWVSIQKKIEQVQ